VTIISATAVVVIEAVMLVIEIILTIKCEILSSSSLA
jgi:hypothetical protein